VPTPRYQLSVIIPASKVRSALVSNLAIFMPFLYTSFEIPMACLKSFIRIPTVDCQGTGQGQCREAVSFSLVLQLILSF